MFSRFLPTSQNFVQFFSDCVVSSVGRPLAACGWLDQSSPADFSAVGRRGAAVPVLDFVPVETCAGWRGWLHQLFSADVDGNTMRFRAPGTAWTAQPNLSVNSRVVEMGLEVDGNTTTGIAWTAQPNLSVNSRFVEMGLEATDVFRLSPAGFSDVSRRGAAVPVFEFGSAATFDRGSGWCGWLHQLFSADVDGNVTRFRAPGTAWTAQPIRRSGRSTLQCPAPDTRVHFLVGVIRTRHQCSIDSAPSPKAPAKTNPTRALKVRLDFFCLFDAPPRVGGFPSKRQQKKLKKEKKEQARVKRQQELQSFQREAAAYFAWAKRQKEDRPRHESPLVISLLRLFLAECFIWCFVDGVLLAAVLRFGVILSVTTTPSVYNRVFVWCFIDGMLLADALRFGVILLVTTVRSVHDPSAAAATLSVEGPVDFAHSVDEADQVVFFMMSFCVFTVHD
jgi:hypothetical protein